MKHMGFFILFLLVGCDPYNFGFKANPAEILKTAFEAVQEEDTETFLSVTGKEVLCLYGNDAGLAYLNRQATLTNDDVKFNLNKISDVHFIIPEYVSSYWSYYNERYSMDMVDKKSSELILQAIVDCDYGSDDKDPQYQNLKRNKYRRKECRLTKLIPKTFAPLKMSKRCQILKVNVAEKKKR